MTDRVPDHGPLFSLPEYEVAGRRFFWDAVHALMRARDDLLGMVHTETVDSLPTSRLTLASDEVVETAPMVMEASFDLSPSDTIAGRMETLYLAVIEAAESGLASMMPQFFANLSEICDATGQTFDASGRGLSHEVMFEALEGIEITFNEDESPNMPTLIVHPETARRLAELPPPTAEQNRQFDEMMDKKRREFFDRRRTRGLSGQPD